MNFYRSPSKTYFVTFGFIAANLTALWYAPDKIPYGRLGFYGTFLKGLSNNCGALIKYGVPLTIAIHFLEGLYAAYLSNSIGLSCSNTLFWFFQTFFAGYPSTRMIIKKAKQVKKAN